MASFLEKLKKGMGAETIEGEEEEEEREEIKEREEKIEEKKQRPKNQKGEEAKEKSYPSTAHRIRRIEVEDESETEDESEIDKEKTLPKEDKITASSLTKEEKERWPEPEGQLAIDVYQTETDLVIQSAIAGVRVENLDISIERDVLVIKGERKKPSEENGDYFTQECYWGPFSRKVVMPVEVDPDRAEATMKCGILTIRIPKIQREKKRIIKVKED